MKYFIKKFCTLIITLFIISFVTFLAFQVIPGDSAVTALGTDASPEQVEALRESYGLNKNIAERYGDWLFHAARGDFGESVNYGIPVGELVGDRFFVTAGLGILSILIIVVLSLPLGILSAKKEGGLWDRLITLISQIGMAVPPFFLGMLITLLFGIVLKWFIPGRYVSFSESPAGYLHYMIFPALAIAVPKTAMMVKFLRSSVLRQMKSDYVRTARSKGNTENKVLYRHVLKNALIPVITFLGMVIADVLAGSIIIEQVFNLPGMGRLLIVGISNRDFPVVQAIVLYIAVLVIMVNFIVDMIYRLIDPRITV